MKKHILRFLLNLSGFLCLILAVIGIVLPLLPTVPFVLLAAICFTQSSPRFHQWLHQHRYFGPILDDYQAGRGIPRTARNRAIALIWGSMCLSMVIIAKLWAVLLLAFCGAGVTLYLLHLPLREEFGH